MFCCHFFTDVIPEQQWHFRTKKTGRIHEYIKDLLLHLLLLIIYIPWPTSSLTETGMSFASVPTRLSLCAVMSLYAAGDSQSD